MIFFKYMYVKNCWLSINDITHLGGGGICQKVALLHITYLIKWVTWGREREESAPNPNNLVSLNYTFLDIFVLLCKPNRSPIDLPWCVQLKFTSKTIIASDRIGHQPTDQACMLYPIKKVVNVTRRHYSLIPGGRFMP